MKSQSNILQPTIWIRGLDNGIRHVTLRRNFEESTSTREDEDIQYVFEETNVYVADRDNLEDYIESNFEILFEQGLINELKPTPPSLEDRLQAIENTILIML
jgi:hypothetical protein